MHDLLEKQGLSPEVIQRPGARDVRRAEGADMNKFKKALDDHSNKAFVERERDRGQGRHQRHARVHHQPIKGKELTGYFVSGAQPYGKFKKAIDAALKDAGEKGGGDDKADKKAEKKAEKKAAK